jgi:hypothetical protein
VVHSNAEGERGLCSRCWLIQLKPDNRLALKPHTTIHMVMDNYGTHKHPHVRECFVRHPKFVPHFTPTSSSWLNRSSGSSPRSSNGAFATVAPTPDPVS